MEKHINLILKKANISKVNLAKYLGVSRQMIYNYFDNDDLSNIPNEKCQLLYKLLNVKSENEILNLEINKEYLESVGNKIFIEKKSTNLKDEVIELNGLKKEEQEAISDIVFILKEMFNEDKTPASLTTVKYFYHFLQAMSNTKELKYILAYVSKAAGYTKPLEFTYNEDQQYVFESIQYSAMTLYSNGNASRNKVAESHKNWEKEIENKKEEQLSRTQELKSLQHQALSELGFSSINESNAKEVFEKIAEIMSRKF